MKSTSAQLEAIIKCNFIATKPSDFSSLSSIYKHWRERYIHFIEINTPTRTLYITSQEDSKLTRL